MKRCKGSRQRVDVAPFVAPIGSYMGKGSTVCYDPLPTAEQWRNMRAHESAAEAMEYFIRARMPRVRDKS